MHFKNVQQKPFFLISQPKHMLWVLKQSNPNVPRSVFICDTAILRIVSLSGFLASVLHVGTMSHSSLMYDVILFLRRLSISQ